MQAGRAGWHEVEEVPSIASRVLGTEESYGSLLRR